jgi:hypothetical protein
MEAQSKTPTLSGRFETNPEGLDIGCAGKI